MGHAVAHPLLHHGWTTVKSHGIAGAKILRMEGFPKHARVAETHIGVGIIKEDIEKNELPLPKEDFVPKTTEEKIIAYADNLIEGSMLKDIKYVIERFRKELGEDYVKRVIVLHNEIEKLIGRIEFL